MALASHLGAGPARAPLNLSSNPVAVPHHPRYLEHVVGLAHLTLHWKWDSPNLGLLSARSWLPGDKKGSDLTFAKQLLLCHGQAFHTQYLIFKPRTTLPAAVINPFSTAGKPSL